MCICLDFLFFQPPTVLFISYFLSASGTANWGNSQGRGSRWICRVPMLASSQDHSPTRNLLVDVDIKTASTRRLSYLSPHPFSQSISQLLRHQSCRLPPTMDPSNRSLKFCSPPPVSTICNSLHASSPPSLTILLHHRARRRPSLSS